MLNADIKVAEMSWKDLTQSGIGYLLLSYVLPVVYVIPLLFLWRTLYASGVSIDMTLSQMLTYTYLGVIFSDILVVRTPASNWLYEGLLISLYQRPMGVLSHLAAQTIGKWIPQLLYFICPMLVLAPLFSVFLRVVTLWFIPSLFLCISLGFAIDFLFACLTIRLKNASWLVYVIRSAIVGLFSGSLIPFALFPWGIGQLFALLPFGSLAAAPLSLYTGLAAVGPVLLLQVFWNLALWPLALYVFRRSQERMVSYGG